LLFLKISAQYGQLTVLFNDVRSTRDHICKDTVEKCLNEFSIVYEWSWDDPLTPSAGSVKAKKLKIKYFDVSHFNQYKIKVFNYNIDDKV
jgi:hypothetical protein